MIRGMQAPNHIGARAIALGDGDRHRAVQELIKLSDGRRPPLEQARAELVGRIQLHSDDYEATSGLTALNAALAEVGWTAAITWEARTQPPRRRRASRRQFPAPD
jgi:hypothetical protein